MRAAGARPNIVSPRTPCRHRGLRATVVSGRDVLVTPPMHRGFDKPDQVDTLLSHAHGCVAILTGRVQWGSVRRIVRQIGPAGSFRLDYGAGVTKRVIRPLKAKNARTGWSS
ncbi:hypothetical protein [Azospirillum palustre]